MEICGEKVGSKVSATFSKGGESYFGREERKKAAVRSWRRPCRLCLPCASAGTPSASALLLRLVRHSLERSLFDVRALPFFS